MGESFNYYNMQLFGYELPTTPFLYSIKDDENFAYQKGLSNAFRTIPSLVVFFNMQREYDNFKPQITQTTNLAKLAKEQGFKVVVISGQERSEIFQSQIANYTDIFVGQEDNEKCFKEKGDECLLEILKEKINLKDGKYFIVLHQRNIHTPYKYNYEHNEAKYKKFEKEYDNGVLMNDYIFENTLEYLKAESKLPFYYFITSDHGELTGQDGLYGHFYNKDVLNIPMLLYTNHKNSEVFRKFKSTFMPTNYELGMLITELFGYKITTPDTPDNVFYLIGDYNMVRQSMIIEKDVKEKKVMIRDID
jgi:glucan phosphoethanolaminetransferase (alkaline phosphatase superfamily)